MQLKAKFILIVALIILCSYGVTFYRTSHFQEELVVQQATRQAKMLFTQIRLTRQWIADHNGLFLVKAPGVEANPFLPDGQVQDADGKWLVKRNPAMVTRELSAYAAREGMGQFNVTSLKPLNPDNKPDQFERTSLEGFSTGLTEAIHIEEASGRHRLRYMAPLEVDSRCLECHNEQGYEIGDIRGGMSVSIPIDWAFTEIKQNNRLLLNIAIATIIIVSLAIYLLFDLLVAKRVKRLSQRMEDYPDHGLASKPKLDDFEDEIGSLNENFHQLCFRLEQSQDELDKTREQVFQNEKQAALGRLVAGISHEINNPLSGMKNCIQTMQRQRENPELQERYLTLMRQGVDRIKETVQQLLNIGRIEPLDIKTGDIDQVIRDSMELISMGHKHISVDLNLNVDRPVTTGIEALRQVIINLGGNAIQAVDEKSGTITINSSLAEQILRIQISDDGPGIAQENLDKIFEPFFTTKEVGEGTGLGLSVSHSLISQLGGTLTASNLPEGGAHFNMEIPLHAIEDSE